MRLTWKRWCLEAHSAMRTQDECSKKRITSFTATGMISASENPIHFTLFHKSCAKVGLSYIILKKERKGSTNWPIDHHQLACVIRYKTNLLVLKVHFAFNLLENFKLSKKILLYNSDFKKNHYGFQNKLQKQKKQKIYSIWFVQCTFKLKLTLSQTESHIIYLT